MRGMSYTELRRQLKRTLDEIADTREPVRITRRNGPSAILIDEEEYSALLETAYLLRSPANAARLVEALDQSRRGEGRVLDANAILDYPRA